MAKILSKYVNLTDSSQEIEYGSQSEYIEALSYNPKLKPKNDLERPYSFRLWYDTRSNIIPGQEYTLYNQYLLEWYQDRKDSDISNKIDTQQAYLDILNQLQSSFRDELAQRALDISDPAEIINEIPKYAKKIKDIARYFILKRESIRRAKLKYNMTGTNQSLERLLYGYLLKAFTKNEINTSVSTTDLPELSAAQNLQIVIEDLYDNTNYFDRDPILPLSSYFLNTSTTSSYLTTHNINTQEEFEWLYNTGVSQLCANNPLLWVVDDVLIQYNNGLPLSAIEDATTEILNDYNRIKLTQKYLGTDQYIISGGYYVAPSSTLILDMVSGNNWFCWPSGQTELTVNSAVLVDIPINETTLIEDGATASSVYTAADVMFVKHNNSLKGAWLQSPSINTEVITMSAQMNQFKKLEFIYPFPGYGVQTDDIEWTGRQYNNLDKTFNFLEKRYQANILKKYWEDTISDNISISSIYLSATNLISSGAHAGKGVLDSDMVIIRPNFNYNNKTHNNTLSAAWLYQPDIGSARWCKAIVDRVSSNEQKGYDIWHGNLLTYDSSDMILEPGIHIEYYNSGPSFIWQENIVKQEFDYNNPSWKKLQINEHYLPTGATIEQLAVSGTNELSDIILSTEPNNPQEINYYAVNAFKWEQTVTDSTLGLPPTGGNWVPVLSGNLISANKPYTNLSNRHYPTYASVPYIDNMYSVKESGGYMIPKNLGVSIALTRNNDNILETIGQDNPNAKVFQDINNYNNDIGFTNITQYTPVSTISVDSEWMRSQFIEGNRAGIITNPNTYQEFVPYQSTYESINKNRLGILQQQDTNSQYETIGNSLSGYELVKWDTDIFGNQYGLYSNSGVNVFWVRDLLGNSSIGYNGLSAVFDEVVKIYSDINGSLVSPESFNESIISFNVFFDTIVFVMPKGIITAKLSIDFDTGSIYTTVNDINGIEKTDNMIYVDHYFFPSEKTVTLGFILICDGLVSGNKQIRPLLYSLDLNNNDLSIIFNTSSQETDFDEAFSSDINSYAMTYDPIRLIYNLSFVQNNHVDGMYIFSFNIQQNGNNFVILETKIIEPV